MSLFALHVSLTFGLLLAAAAAGVVGLRRQGASDVVYGLSALAAAGGAGFAVVHGILCKSPAALALPGGLPGVGIRLRINSLSLVFLVVVNAVAALVSLYAVGYGRHEHPGRVLALYPLFLIGMNVVLIADDAFTFLIGWEFMSLASWGMVAARHEDPEARRAAHLYLLMACGGAFALLFAFGVLAGHGWRLCVRRHSRPRPLPAGCRFWRWLLVLIGTGSKAGLVPLHVWLPLAHPAAPSHVSALMSGVMTKVAIYGTIRSGVRPDAGAAMVLGAAVPVRRHLDRADRPAAGAGGARPQAAAGVLDHREHRHHLCGARAGGGVHRDAASTPRRRWRSPRRCSTSPTTR